MSLESRADSGASINPTTAWLMGGYDAESADAALATANYVPAPGPARAFRVGTTAGDVKVRTLAGHDCVIPNVQVGETVECAFTIIYKTGTTAVGITAFG